MKNASVLKKSYSVDGGWSIVFAVAQISVAIFSFFIVVD